MAQNTNENELVNKKVQPRIKLKKISEKIKNYSQEIKQPLYDSLNK